MDRNCRLCGSQEAFLVSLSDNHHHQILLDFITANLNIRLSPGCNCTVCGKCIGSLESWRQLKQSVQNFQTDTARHHHNEPPLATEPQSPHHAPSPQVEFNPSILTAVSLATSADPLNVMSIKTEPLDLPIITSSISLADTSIFQPGTPTMVPNCSRLELDERVVKQEPLDVSTAASPCRSDLNQQSPESPHDSRYDESRQPPDDPELALDTSALQLPTLDPFKQSGSSLMLGGSRLSVNLKDLVIECLQCSQCVNTVEEMKVHYSSEHGIDKLPLQSKHPSYNFVCLKCERKFIHYNYARTHAKEHRDNSSEVSNGREEEMEADGEEEECGQEENVEGQESEDKEESENMPVKKDERETKVDTVSDRKSSDVNEDCKDSKDSVDSKERVKQQIRRHQMLHAHYRFLKEDSDNNNVELDPNVKIETLESLQTKKSKKTDNLVKVCCKLLPTRDKMLRVSQKENQAALETLKDNKASLLSVIVKTENIYSDPIEENSDYSYVPPDNSIKNNSSSNENNKTNAQTDHFLVLASSESQLSSQDSLGDDPKQYPLYPVPIENNFQCNLCNVYFPTIENLGDHMKRHTLQIVKKNYDDGMNMKTDIRCNFCPSLIKVKGFRTHFEKFHSNVNFASEPEHLPGTSNLRCTFCREEFKRTAHFESHMKPCFVNRLIMQHLEQKVVKDKNLSKEDLLEIELNDFKKPLNDDKEPLVLPPFRKYNKRKNVPEHKDEKNKGDYECPRCKLQCGTRLKYDIHYSFHVPVLAYNVKPSFYCDECHMNLPSVTSARNHLKKVHLTKNKSWIFCKHCLESYETHKSFTKHMELANGIGTVDNNADAALEENSATSDNVEMLKNNSNEASVEGKLSKTRQDKTNDESNGQVRGKHHKTLINQLKIDSNFTPSDKERRPKRRKHESGYYENLTKDSLRNHGNQRDSHARSSSTESASSTRTSRSNRSSYLTPRELSPEPSVRKTPVNGDKKKEEKTKEKVNTTVEKKTVGNNDPAKLGELYYDQMGAVRPTFTCLYCSLRFATRHVKQEHQKMCKIGKWKDSKIGGNCNLCNVYFVDLATHSQIHGNQAHRFKTEKKYIYVYQCPLCMTDMKSSISSFNSHVKQCQQRGRSEFRCKFCKKQMNGNSWKTRHQKMCNATVAFEKLRKAKTPLLKCTYCCRHVLISREAHDEFCKEPVEKSSPCAPDSSLEKNSPSTEQSKDGASTSAANKTAGTSSSGKTTSASTSKEITSKKSSSKEVETVVNPKVTTSEPLVNPKANTPSSKSDSNKCKKCGKTFGLKFAYNKHVLKCHVATATQQSPSKENNANLKANTCFLCPFVPVDSRPASLYQHYTRIHKLKIHSTGSRSHRLYYCLYCKKPCKEFVMFNLHGHFHEKQKRAIEAAKKQGNSNEKTEQGKAEVTPSRKEKPAPLSVKTRERSKVDSEKAASTSTTVSKESPVQTKPVPIESTLTLTTRSGTHVRPLLEEATNSKSQPSTPVESKRNLEKVSPDKSFKRLTENARIMNSYKKVKKIKRTKCEHCNEFVANCSYTRHTLMCIEQFKEKTANKKLKHLSRKQCLYCKQHWPIHMFQTHSFKCEMKNSYRSKSESSVKPTASQALKSGGIVLKPASQLLKAAVLSVTQANTARQDSPIVKSTNVSAKSSSSPMTNPNPPVAKYLPHVPKPLSKKQCTPSVPIVSPLKSKNCSLIEVISLDGEETVTIPIPKSKELTIIKLPNKATDSSRKSTDATGLKSSDVNFYNRTLTNANLITIRKSTDATALNSSDVNKYNRTLTNANLNTSRKSTDATGVMSSDVNVYNRTSSNPNLNTSRKSSDPTLLVSRKSLDSNQPKPGSKRALDSSPVIPTSEEPSRKNRRKSPLGSRSEPPPYKKIVQCPLCFQDIHKRSCGSHYSYYHLKEVNELSTYVELLGLKEELARFNLHKGIFCPTCEKTFTREAMKVHYKNHSTSRLEFKHSIKLLGFCSEHEFLDFLDNCPIPQSQSVEVIDIIDTSSPPPSSTVVTRKKTLETRPVVGAPSASTSNPSILPRERRSRVVSVPQEESPVLLSSTGRNPAILPRDRRSRLISVSQEESPVPSSSTGRNPSILPRDRRSRLVSVPQEESPRLEEKRITRQRERKEKLDDSIDENLSLADLMAARGLKRLRKEKETDETSKRPKRTQNVLEVSAPILLNEDDADYLGECSLEDPLADPFGACAEAVVHDKTSSGTPYRSYNTDDEETVVYEIPRVDDWASLENRSNPAPVQNIAVSKQEIEKKHQLAKNIQSQINDRIQAVLNKKKEEEVTRKQKEEEERKRVEETAMQKKSLNVSPVKPQTPPPYVPPPPKTRDVPPPPKTRDPKPQEKLTSSTEISVLKRAQPSTSNKPSTSSRDHMVKTLAISQKTKIITITPTAKKSDGGSPVTPKFDSSNPQKSSNVAKTPGSVRKTPTHQTQKPVHASPQTKPAFRLLNISSDDRPKTGNSNKQLAQRVEQKLTVRPVDTPKQVFAVFEKTEKLKNKLLLKFQKDKSQDSYQISQKTHGTGSLQPDNSDMKKPYPEKPRPKEPNLNLGLTLTKQLRDVKMPKRNPEDVARNSALLSKVQSISRENKSLLEKVPNKTIPPQEPSIKTPNSTATSTNGVVTKTPEQIKKTTGPAPTSSNQSTVNKLKETTSSGALITKLAPEQNFSTTGNTKPSSSVTFTPTFVSVDSPPTQSNTSHASSESSKASAIELFPPPPSHLVGFPVVTRPLSPTPTKIESNTKMCLPSPESPPMFPSLSKTVAVSGQHLTSSSNPSAVYTDLSPKTPSTASAHSNISQTTSARQQSSAYTSPSAEPTQYPKSRDSPWHVDHSSSPQSAPSLVEYPKPSTYLSPSQPCVEKPTPVLESHHSRPASRSAGTPSPYGSIPIKSPSNYPEKPMGQSYGSTTPQQTTKLPPVSSLVYRNTASPYPFSNSPSSYQESAPHNSPEPKYPYPSSPYGSPSTSNLTDNLLSIPIAPKRPLAVTRATSITSLESSSRSYSSPTSFTPVSKSQSPNYACLSTTYPITSAYDSPVSTSPATKAKKKSITTSTSYSSPSVVSTQSYSTSYPPTTPSSSNLISYPVSSTPQTPSSNLISYPVSSTPQTPSSNLISYPVSTVSSSNLVSYPVSTAGSYPVSTAGSYPYSYNTPSVVYSSAHASHFQSPASGYIYPPVDSLPQSLPPLGESLPGFRPYEQPTYHSSPILYDYPPAPGYAGNFLPPAAHHTGYSTGQYNLPRAPTPPPGYYNPPPPPPPHPDTY